MSVTIRRLDPDEIKQAGQLYQGYMQLNVPREPALRQSIERDDSEILVAETQGMVVGLIHQVFYVDPLHAGVCSNILFLYVREPFRRQRVGSLLVEGALNSVAREASSKFMSQQGPTISLRLSSMRSSSLSMQGLFLNALLGSWMISLLREFSARAFWVLEVSPESKRAPVLH